ncbi:hypothetical protein T440DRAFT_491061 [Plenodomus tracheiphilus IPT5]|uniref:Uncharacterized protein n=1 Tax=Plenodomus tracheiphilus IPT5 TaxID=1408161 RepID=A0A6A7AZH2_9PLEO|nr:hypothetical protein T440DRAFT_491061 [Plenodomus tracheiphilus IPT5]
MLSVLMMSPDSSTTAIYPPSCRDVASIDDLLPFPNPSRRQTTVCCHGSSLSRCGDTPPCPVQLHCHDPRLTFILTLKPCRRFQLQKVITPAKRSTGSGFLNHVALCLGLETPQIPCQCIAPPHRWASMTSRLQLEASLTSHLICSCCNHQSWVLPPAIHYPRLTGTLVITACILHSTVSPIHSADQWLHSTAGFSRVRPIVDMLGPAR